MENLTTEVWLLSGVTGSERALMAHQDGRVMLQMIDEEAEGFVDRFDVALAEIADVKWPKMQMSGGCTFVVDDTKFRVSFMRPQNTRSGFIGDAQGVASISGGRKAGKAWKAILPS